MFEYTLIHEDYKPAVHLLIAMPHDRLVTMTLRIPGWLICIKL